MPIPQRPSAVPARSRVYAVPRGQAPAAAAACGLSRRCRKASTPCSWISCSIRPRMCSTEEEPSSSSALSDARRRNYAQVIDRHQEIGRALRSGWPESGRLPSRLASQRQRPPASQGRRRGATKQQIACGSAPDREAVAERPHNAEAVVGGARDETATAYPLPPP